MAAKNDSESANEGKIERVRGQLETIEKYITRDIDRIDETIIDVYKRVNEVEKLVSKVKGAWMTIGVVAALLGTAIGWALQAALVAWRINSGN